MAKKMRMALVGLVALVSMASYVVHPIFVSVVEIEHNAKDRRLEISCKLFTDDFEKALRLAYSTHVDLTDKKYEPAMNKLVNDYLQKHLAVTVNGRPVKMDFVGYEQIEDGVYSYFQVDNVPDVQQLQFFDDALYEFSAEQMSIVHFKNKGVTSSGKIANPANRLTFTTTLGKQP